MNRGDNVIRVPCPLGCPCDANKVPVGTEGVIIANSDGRWKQTHAITLNGKVRTEWYIYVQWDQHGLKKNWWVMTHAMELCDAHFPDLSYLEGV